MQNIYIFYKYSPLWAMGENENVFHVNGNVSVSPPGRKKDVDWHQFGLSTEEKNHSSSIKNSINSSRESNEQVKELFEHEQEVQFAKCDVAKRML